MRIFEAALILVNLLTLLLSFKKQSKVVRLGTAGLNLSVFIIHGIFEGFRYQMIFSYVFVILFVIYTLVKTTGKFFTTKTPRMLKGIAISLSFVFLAFTSFLAYALPVFTLPKPTGGYAVGIKYFHFIDEKRYEPFLDKPTKKRELMVKVYYPAKKDNSKPFDRYFHHSPRLINLYITNNGIPGFVFYQLNLVKTNSKETLPLSAKKQNYPVVLFSHGAGATMEVETSQCEDLASHGYIVAAIDHTYASAATVFPDRIVSAREATTNFSDPTGMISQIMADDCEFVIETLSAMNEGKIDSKFKGKLNLDEIGAIGHSLGGAVAYNLAINDIRIKAAIDLDGSVYITPKDDVKNMAPFLMLANDKIHIQAIRNRDCLMPKLEDMPEGEVKQTVAVFGSREAYNDAYRKAYQNIAGLAEVLKASGNLFTIEGSDHMKFTDIGLFIGVRPLRELIGISGKTAPAKCLEITEKLTLAFFDRQLKGETGESPETLVKKYPELKRVALK